MRKAMCDAGLRQKAPDGRRRIRGNDGKRAVSRERPHHVHHPRHEIRRVVGVQLGEEMARHFVRLRLVAAEPAKTGEEILLEQPEILLLGIDLRVRKPHSSARRSSRTPRASARACRRDRRGRRAAAWVRPPPACGSRGPRSARSVAAFRRNPGSRHSPGGLRIAIGRAR